MIPSVINDWLRDDDNSDTVNEMFHGETWGEMKCPEGFELNLQEHFGGEGQGEDYWSVWEFKNSETEAITLIKFDGWYQSYAGSEFNEFFEVAAKEVVKTEYNRA